MAVRVCSWTGVDKHSGAHTVYHLVGVYNQEKLVDLFSASLSLAMCVCMCVRSMHQRRSGVISDMCQGPRSRVIIYKHTQRNWVQESIGACGTTWLTLSPITYTTYTFSVSSLLSVNLLIDLFLSPPICLHSAIGNRLFTLRITSTKHVRNNKICESSWCHSMHDEPQKYSANSLQYNNSSSDARVH